MVTGTGQTIYEQIVSLNQDNYPVSGATFDIEMYRDGAIDSSVTVNVSLADATRAVFTASWSATTTGDYQMYAKNNSTQDVFISDTVIIKSDDELDTNVYIGL